MDTAQRRVALIRVLAEIDQRIREAESRASSPCLPAPDRRSASAQASYRRRFAKRVESMIRELNRTID